MSAKSLSTKVYNVGAMPTVEATFTLDGVLKNPTTVICHVQDPDGEIRDVSGDLIHASTGVYQYDCPVVEGSTWVRISGTGEVVGAVEAQITGRTPHALNVT
jgi:hypothetical protein